MDETPAFLAQVDDLQMEIVDSGEPDIPGDLPEFKQWLKEKAEQELWFFSRWILGNDHLSLGSFHRTEIAPFLTDFRSSRCKLLMLPMGHLKTTLVSRSMPLHVMVQPKESNLYFPFMRGAECRVLLGNENELKSKENMDVTKRHAEYNPLLPWLWPDVFWDDPKKQSPRWSDVMLEFKRSGVYAEASITVLGIKTGFIGKYYDMILPDDIVGPEARDSPKVMEKAKKWRRTSKTRFYNKFGPRQGIHIGIGTHWGSDDVYVEWKRDPSVEVMIRSIEEPDAQGVLRPIWPEKYPPDLVDKMHKETDPIEWALWWMNQPVSAGYTALRWEDLREYTVTDGGRTLVFADSILDERITRRLETKAQNLGFRLMTYDPALARARKQKPKDMDGESFEYLRYKHAERIPLTPEQQVRVDKGEDLRAVLFGPQPELS